jgi:putative oxidoreductase
MLVAIVTAHSSAFFLPAGMEYALSLLAMSLALIFSGGGALSADARLTHTQT